MNKFMVRWATASAIVLAYLYIGGMGLFRYWGWPDFAVWEPLERTLWWFLGHLIAGGLGLGYAAIRSEFHD